MSRRKEQVRRAVDRAQNPLPAGLIALVAAAVAAYLLPRGGRREQQAIDRVKDGLEPARQQALETARGVAGELRGSAQQRVVGVVKDQASQVAKQLKGGGRSRADQAEKTSARAKGSAKGSAKKTTKATKAGGR